MIDLSPEMILSMERFVYSLLLLALIILLIFWQKLGINQEIIISAIRGFFQLLILAIIIFFIFDLDQVGPLVIILLVMIIFGSITISNRLKDFQNVFSTIILTLLITVIIVMSLSVVLSIIPPTGEFFIPIGGMVTGNAMNMVYLTLNRTLGEVKNKKDPIESALSLGISPKIILNDFGIKRLSIVNGLTPTLNNLKTLGLVFIPGLMSGMIIAGVDPIVAAFYQVIIFFLLILAGLLASIISSYLIVDKIFDKETESLRI